MNRWQDITPRQAADQKLDLASYTDAARLLPVRVIARTKAL